MVPERMKIGEEKPFGHNGNGSGGIETIDIGRAEDQRPLEVSILDSRIQRILYFGVQGPRRLMRPLLKDLRKKLLNLSRNPLEDLPDYHDERGAWKVLYTAPAAKNPNRKFCLLLRPDIKNTKGKICRIVPEEKIVYYQQGQTGIDRNSQKVLAASGIR